MISPICGAFFRSWHSGCEEPGEHEIVGQLMPHFVQRTTAETVASNGMLNAGAGRWGHVVTVNATYTERSDYYSLEGMQKRQ
jgi:hypothetical protein